MSDFLNLLVRRSLQSETALKPRLLSRYESDPTEIGSVLQGPSLEMDSEGLEEETSAVAAGEQPASKLRRQRLPQIMSARASSTQPGSALFESSLSSDPEQRPALTTVPEASQAPAQLPALEISRELIQSLLPPVQLLPDQQPIPTPEPGEVEDVVARAELAALTTRLERLKRDAPIEAHGPIRQIESSSQIVLERTAPVHPGGPSPEPTTRSEINRPKPLQPLVKVVPVPMPDQTDHEPPAAPIQVSIGRVEVRAVSPPTTPARKPSSGPTLSLEDYLRQRNRE